MTEEINNTELTHDEDELELLNSLNPKVELNALGENQHKIVYDGDNFKKALDKVKGTKAEAVVMENDLLGIRVQFQSKTKSVSELQGLALGSMNWLMKNIPTKIPLGVG